MRTSCLAIFGAAFFLLILPRVISAEDPPAAGTWESATGGYAFHFPEDHEAHPNFKTEWWYFTGNVQGPDGHAYGYELTFFRQGTTPPARLSSLFNLGVPRSRFVQSDFKFAHFAITDVDDKRFAFAQKNTRGAFGEAGTAKVGAKTPLVWIDDWTLEPQPDGTWRIQAKTASPTAMSIDLTLRQVKPPVVHGIDGVSQKADGKGDASHYYSFTRLTTTGTLSFGAKMKPVEVTGDSWFDHEWASNQLAANQIGWNWFCFQFDDQTELMIYAMRRRDGSIDPVSGGTFVNANGTSQHLSRDQIELTPGRTWRSTKSSATYPLEWQIRVPSLQLEVAVKPKLDDQELFLPPVTYWEGATADEAHRAGTILNGHGYMELTGYAGALNALQSAR